MTITHLEALRNNIANVVDDHVNTGAGTAVLQLRASTTVLVEFDLSNPAFGASALGVITLNSTPIAATGEAAGNADNFQLVNRNGDVSIAGSVTGVGGGGDIEVTNVNIAIGQDCELQSFSYAAPT